MLHDFYLLDRVMFESLKIDRRLVDTSMLQKVRCLSCLLSCCSSPVAPPALLLLVLMTWPCPPACYPAASHTLALHCWIYRPAPALLAPMACHCPAAPCSVLSSALVPLCCLLPASSRSVPWPPVLSRTVLPIFPSFTCFTWL